MNLMPISFFLPKVNLRKCITGKKHSEENEISQSSYVSSALMDMVAEPLNELVKIVLFLKTSNILKTSSHTHTQQDNNVICCVMIIYW